MPNHFPKYPLLWAILLLPLPLFSQDPDALKKQADEQFEQGNFEGAIVAYAAYHAASPGNAEVLTSLGFCQYEMGNLGEAEKHLYTAVQTKGAGPEAYLYLGKVAHARLRFEEAARYYKQFLRDANKNHPARAAVKDDLLRCANGLHVRRQPQQAVVVNLGAPVNSDGDEFRPLLSPNENDRLYFAAAKKNGTTASDLFSADLKNGEWSAPTALSVFLNSAGHEVPQGFDERGGLFYFFRGDTPSRGEILVDTLRKNKLEGTLFSQPFNGPANAAQGDRDLFFFSDSILLFASRKQGGLGGLDLYVATLRPHGWSAPENLGPDINSAYDEASPFLATDGRTLYFSTNDARRSIGGTDLMRAVFLDRAGKWTPAENLGPPFNSAGDDEYFVLAPDGSRAFFSSSRKTGLGQRDLYVGIFEKTKTEELRFSQPVAFHLVQPDVAAPTAPPPAPAAAANGALLLTPLRFPDPNMPPTEASFAKLKEVAGWMKKHPALRVTFAAHAAPGDGPGVCEAALQQVLEVLEAEAAPLGNVALRNLAAAFPLPEGDAAAQRRVDILLANPEVLPVPVEWQEVASSRAFFFQKAMNRLVFQVKMPLENGAVPDGLFLRYPEGTLLSVLASGQTAFLHGLYLTWDAAVEAQKDFERSGFPDASAVPFLRGWELSGVEAAGLVAQYPDLAGFIRQ